MNNSIDTFIFILLLIFGEIVVAQDSIIISDFMTVIENVQEYYLSRSLYIIYNQRQFSIYESLFYIPYKSYNNHEKKKTIFFLFI